jgi:lathosterol oxidase
MDILLELADDYVFDKAYAYMLPHPPIPQSLKMNTTSYPSYTSTTYLPSTSSLLPRDNMLRQCISLYTIALVGALILYYAICSFSYFLFFDKRLEHHPRFLKNQISMEIKSSMIAAPTIGLLTLPWFLAEVRGKSLLYDSVEEYGWGFMALSVGLYMFFNDFFIYWIHRLEHHPRIYKHIHKPHHKWISKLIRFTVFGLKADSSSHTMGCSRFPPS